MLGSGILAVFNCFNPWKHKSVSLHESWIKPLNFTDVIVGTFETKPHLRSPPKYIKSDPIFIYCALCGIKTPPEDQNISFKYIYSLNSPWTVQVQERGTILTPSPSSFIILSFFFLLSSRGLNFNGSRLVWGGEKGTLSLTKCPRLPSGARPSTRNSDAHKPKKKKKSFF